MVLINSKQLHLLSLCSLLRIYHLLLFFGTDNLIANYIVKTSSLTCEHTDINLPNSKSWFAQWMLQFPVIVALSEMKALAVLHVDRYLSVWTTALCWFSGGLWSPHKPEVGLSTAYEHLVTNSSKEMMAFSDLPYPVSYPSFLKRSMVCASVCLCVCVCAWVSAAGNMQSGVLCIFPTTAVLALKHT